MHQLQPAQGPNKGLQAGLNRRVRRMSELEATGTYVDTEGWATALSPFSLPRWPDVTLSNFSIPPTAFGHG